MGKTPPGEVYCTRTGLVERCTSGLQQKVAGFRTFYYISKSRCYMTSLSICYMSYILQDRFGIATIFFHMSCFSKCDCKLFTFPLWKINSLCVRLSTSSSLFLQAGKLWWNDVLLTLMRRHYVASTWVRRHFETLCPLGFSLPCRIVFAYLEDLEVWPNHLSFRLAEDAKKFLFLAHHIPQMVARIFCEHLHNWNVWRPVLVYIHLI